MDSNVSSALSVGAQPARACSTCVRAKAKCVPGTDSHGKCQRCHRLEKHCEPPAARAKSDQRKRKLADNPRVSKARVEMLEEKVESLVKLLKTTKQNELPLHLSPPATVPHSGNSSSPADDWDERLQIGGNVSKSFQLPLDVASSLKLQPPLGSTQSEFQIMPIRLPFQTPDEALNIFRYDKSSNLPFVVIPDDITAEDLRRDQPSLYTAVMTVTCRDTRRQRELAKDFTQQIADRVHMRHERTMDLLLATLTFAGFYMQHCFNIPGLTGHLASMQALVCDLGINRPGGKEDMSHFKAMLLASHGMHVREHVRTLDERRVALGCWYLTAVVAASFHRLDSPPWTLYLEECCEFLKISGEHPSDLYAVGLGRLQQLTERITQSPWHARQRSTASVNTSAPPALYIKSVEANIEEIKSDFEQLEHYSVPLRLGLEHCRILLYKIGLSKDVTLASLPNVDFNRIDLLFKCVDACKAYFKIYLDIPSDRYHTITVPMCTQLTANLGILQLLSTYENPEWDLVWLQQNIWFPNVVKRVEEKYSGVKTSLGLDPHTTDLVDIFSQAIVKMVKIRTHFEEKHAEGQSGVQGAFNPTNIEGVNLGDFLDLEDVWMPDIFMPWDFQPPN